MRLLTEKLGQKAEQLRADRTKIGKEFGDKKVAEVIAGQVVGGMRGVPALLCDTSTVAPDEGVRYRDVPIKDLVEAKPQDIFYLLCTGEMPNDAESKDLSDSFAEHQEVPDYIWRILEAMPEDSHPMTMFSTAILAMGNESRFRTAYNNTPKDKLWESMLEDAIILLARITSVASGIYRLRFKKGDRIGLDNSLTWSENFARTLGLSDSADFTKLIQMYLVLHADHGGGNVSAFTANTVSSALSDVYYSLSAGLNGLAGPLHGLANQECLKFVIEIYEKFGKIPSTEELEKLLWDRLSNRQVVPGYGHAVLRVEDPRFTALYNFGKDHIQNDEIFQTVDKLYNVAPKVLKEHGKAKNVMPNVDAGSGSLLYHYGMKEYSFYTVMFGVSRAMGIASQLVINRLSLAPITRPKAMTTVALKSAIGA
jgi:citrate synthase